MPVVAFRGGLWSRADGDGYRTAQTRAVAGLETRLQGDACALADASWMRHRSLHRQREPPRIVEVPAAAVARQDRTEASRRATRAASAMSPVGRAAARETSSALR
jgi:hypothetical protein